METKMETGLLNSVFDVIENNFKAIKAKVFLLRVCYAGEHSFDNPEETLMAYFKNNITVVNSSYCDAPLNGFLLMYQKYFVALVEGSEEGISRQIRLFVAGDHQKLFGRTKLLNVYHNIRERLLREKILTIFTTPATLATKMSTGAPISYHFEVLETFLSKVDKLVLVAVENAQFRYSTTSIKDMKTEYLPEYALLEYVLGSPYLINLDDYAVMYHSLPDYQFSFERCWPAAYDFTPRVVDKKSFEEVFVETLPKEFDPDQVVEEEEERENVEEEAEATADV